MLLEAHFINTTTNVLGKKDIYCLGGRDKLYKNHYCITDVLNRPEKQLLMTRTDDYVKVFKGRELIALAQENTHPGNSFSRANRNVREFRARSYKTFFMLNSTEHEISTAHKN